MPSIRRISDRCVVLGLGSNLGARTAFLRNAAAAIESLEGVSARGRSSIFESAPVGGPPQDDYLNAAVLIATELPFGALMLAVLAIERSLGRIRPDAVRWGPRTIDIDLLWCASETSEAEDAVVPHPRLLERPFALQPLLELEPTARDLNQGCAYADAPAARASLRRVGSL